ncbi:MAG: S8 family serine peptidase [Verrucomicrobiales bacterium]
MEEKRTTMWAGLAGLLVLGITLFFADRMFKGLNFDRKQTELAPSGSALAMPPHPQNSGSPSNEIAVPFTNLLLELLKSKLEGLGAISNEVLLRFRDDDGYRAFLARARGLGLNVIDSMDSLRSVRVGYSDLNDVYKDYLANNDEYGEVGANYQVNIPGIPENRQAQIEIPFGAGALGWLGINGDTSLWGDGITIAVLDSGVQPHLTFAENRVRSIDFSQSVENSDATTVANDSEGHGTAVASIAAGDNPNAQGVAPAADILSIKITGADGMSDSFTLAKAIIEAVDQGADVINVSLGSYGDSSLVRDAVAYATDAGKVIVAAAGNDTYSELAFPARYEDVISVGAVDAEGQQLSFSNSGEGLDLTAPGLDVVAAWPGDLLINFSGTSASAPFVTGSIAALMSIYPGTTAIEAAQMLETYSNEAGALGADSAFGEGILDVGRVVQHDTPGITDVAVASHYVDLASIPEGETPMVDIIVENRGTTIVNGATLNITSDNNSRSYALPALDPGEAIVREFPIDTRLGEAQGDLTFSSELTLPGGQDFSPSDNSRTSVILFNDPAAADTSAAASDS